MKTKKFRKDKIMGEGLKIDGKKGKAEVREEMDNRTDEPIEEIQKRTKMSFPCRDVTIVGAGIHASLPTGKKIEGKP